MDMTVDLQLKAEEASELMALLMGMSMAMRHEEDQKMRERGQRYAFLAMKVQYAILTAKGDA